ncbi:hypothetical protein CBR_g44323 [Chara braunii]|uniref:Tf2-1-like SH3-like domain-containing protein n=1 Tax=Chara braunii TaxID=69332 RepID=A0A388K316_CHABU|nr:hypothetical protein CBR_g44323 [Chara braunii]|eukprot:GBG64438.1 hypothetical protein CBR_g44323 [Chara braunii]
MIEQANRHRRPSTFKEGDLVWVKSKEFSLEKDVSQKLLPVYFGPWEVLKVTGDAKGPSYRIDVPPHLKTYPVFHASKQLPYVEGNGFPNRPIMIPRSMEGRYDVDRIIEHGYFSTRGRGRPQKQFKTLSLKPDWPKGYSRVGAALMGLNRYEEAIEVYEKGLKLDKENENLKEGLEQAKVLKEKEDQEDAKHGRHKFRKRKVEKDGSGPEEDIMSKKQDNSKRRSDGKRKKTQSLLSFDCEGEAPSADE